MTATILQLEVEGVKRIKAVRIVPKDSTVVITGANDQGKTSVLDSIDYAFRGEKEICEEPLRHGEKRGKVKIQLSEELNEVCTIERRFTPGGTVLEIRNKDGVPQKSPQALLDAIIAKMSFDPLSFIRKGKQEQMEMLRKLVGLDFTEVNQAKRLAFDERTIRNREVEAAKTKLLAHPFDASLPKEPVSIQDLALKLGEAKQKNSSIRQRRQAVESQDQKVFDLSEDVRALQEKLKQLKAMIVSTEMQIDSKVKSHAEAQIEAERMKGEIVTLQAVDEELLQKQIGDIQQTNAQIEQNRLHLAAKENLELLEGTVRGLSAKIKECDDQKAAQIEFAVFPMEELGFDEERGVLLNGVPFQQGSQARQLQAAIAIGLALNPKVKVILIRDGSLLDDKSLKDISELIAKNGAQLWIEIVSSKDPSAIVIEDGEVK
jgi:DNA repair exonuclease SbcCD ATPase subunit